MWLKLCLLCSIFLVTFLFFSWLQPVATDHVCSKHCFLQQPVISGQLRSCNENVTLLRLARSKILTSVIIIRQILKSQITVSQVYRVRTLPHHTTVSTRGMQRFLKTLSHWYSFINCSHHCLGSNPSWGKWESYQWLGVRQWFSPGTHVSSPTYNWIVTI